MVGAMRQELIGGSYIQADETPIDVQIQEVGRKIIERISGTVDREKRRVRLSEDGMAPSSFWGDSEVYCRPMDMPPMINSGGRPWCTPAAGLMWRDILNFPCVTISVRLFLESQTCPYHVCPSSLPVPGLSGER